MDDRTPVVIGAGQFTYRGDPLASPTPLELLLEASRRAARSAGLAEARLAEIDHLGVVGFTVDAGGAISRLPVPRVENPPASLARRLGATPRRAVYSHMGGNTPQQMVNHLAGAIARGEADFALAVGAEFLGSLMKRLRAGRPFPEDWGEAADAGPERFGDPRPGVSPEEAAYGLGFPVNAYPLFENALRARDGRSLEAHQARLGALFAPFTRVAGQNPHAWFPVERTAEELVAVSPQNRMVSYPYPKYLNAIMEVDQSAAVLIASAGAARAMGVDPATFVHLHGCADAADLWHITDRQDYCSSPAIRLSGRRAFEMAGAAPSDVELIDLYSCFPVAVEIAAEELGLALDDPRGLTLTGGLPYAGGPGNNYAMHAIATLRDRLLHIRRAEGRTPLGLITANGWFLTKQSIGLYGMAPPERPFEREDPARLQAEIDALPHPPTVARPEGPARVETYTVCHGREGYRMGIVIGRDAQDRRFVAHLPEDPAALRDFEAREGVGRAGTVAQDEKGLNLFQPAVA